MGEVVITFNGGETIDMSDLQGYQEVIREAFSVHFAREKIRHGLWKQYAAKDQIKQIKIKSDRAEHTLDLFAGGPTVPTGDEAEQSLIDATVEELYDIINYAVFAVRQLTGTA